MSKTRLLTRPLKSAVSALALFIGAFTGLSYADDLVPTPQEIQQLGTTLTPWGAEKAGSADGLIPPYTGGLTTPPPDFVPGSGKYPDPYRDEKPIAVITATNLAQYADKVTPGEQEMLKRYPDYHLNVYPTHRSVYYPAVLTPHCVDNALHARLVPSGYGYTGGYGCVPFPIPKTGLQLLWNHMSRGGSGTAVAEHNRFRSYQVDSSGAVTDIGDVEFDAQMFNVDPKNNSLKDAFYYRSATRSLTPAGQAGTRVLIWRTSNFDSQDDLTWLYQVGQRRVRVAPEFRYDTPVAQYGGVLLWDEFGGFSGKPDRFDWKIVGKKEIYVIYNTYKALYETVPIAMMQPKFANPDAMRWELHRVWVLEADLKPDSRHVLSKKIFYIDEDMDQVLEYDGYDHSGALTRVTLLPSAPLYDVGYWQISNIVYDLAKGSWLFTGLEGYPEGYHHVIPEPVGGDQALTADGMMASSFR